MNTLSFLMHISKPCSRVKVGQELLGHGLRACPSLPYHAEGKYFLLYGTHSTAGETRVDFRNKLVSILGN